MRLFRVTEDSVLTSARASALVESMSELLSSREAADIIGCHHTTVPRLVKDGELVPAMKGPGSTGAFFFRPEDVASLARKRAAS